MRSDRPRLTWREFLLPNPAFPIRAYNLPGVRIGSLRLVPASRLLKAANALNQVGDAGKIPTPVGISSPWGQTIVGGN